MVAGAFRQASLARMAALLREVAVRHLDHRQRRRGDRGSPVGRRRDLRPFLVLTVAMHAAERGTTGSGSGRCDMLVVIAVGGKNLLEPADGPAPGSLRAGVRVAAAAVAEVARDHQVVVTHGGSPQVGLFAYRRALVQRAVEHSRELGGGGAGGV